MTKLAKSVEYKDDIFEVEYWDGRKEIVPYEEAMKNPIKVS